MPYEIIKTDPYLEPYEYAINERMLAYADTKGKLLKKGQSLIDFANGYEYFGFHRVRGGWVYREWAPAAEALYLTGDFNGWDTRSHPLTALENGVYEIKLKGKDALREGDYVQVIVIHKGEELRRIPLYATRVVQN